MEITIVTLFPEWFEGPLGDSVIGRARDAGRLSFRFVNPRDFSTDRHSSVDDAPYGGGGGMVLRADVLARALDSAIGPPGAEGRPHVCMMSPRAEAFDQAKAIALAAMPRLALVCGHYEAVDQRFIDTRVDEELSMGDFVLTGGEIPAMAVVDAVARMLPGVLGNEVCAVTDSYRSGLLEGPHYTRPEVFEGIAVPEVLKSGNHAAIEKWREEEALRLTHLRRPELWRAMLLRPEQIRRLARRGRPFAVWRTGDAHPFELLFAPPMVRALLVGNNPPRSVRHPERGMVPGVCFAEIREANGDSAEADRAALCAQVNALMEEPDGPQGYCHPDARGFLSLLAQELNRPE